MDLSEFPRPPADNGRGIHWSPGVANQVGDNVIRDYWLPELQAMGMKWVKFMSIGGGGLAELLLASGIMPVVRLGGRKSLPGAIDDARHGGAYVEDLIKYVDQGVRYFEVCNEPNLPTEWVSGVLPPDHEVVETVIGDWVKSVQVILDHGGYPGFPALAPGGVYDDVRFFREACQWLVDHGHQSLMQQGVWIAVHNYSLHRPWDYPEDDVNQWGTPVTPQEYGHHRWWNDQRWDQVNELRATHTNHGQTIMDDSNAFRKFEQFHRIWVDQFGFTVPILSTEGGYTVTQPGEGFGDHRYPWIDFDLHARGTVRQYEYMMREAPPCYFCTADWIIANAHLGNPDPQWESQAWYTSFFANQGVRNHLPTVDAVKAMPNEPRQPASGPAQGSVVKGAVANAAGIKVTLRGGPAPHEQTADEGGRFEFTRLPAGVYNLDVDTLGTVAKDLTTTGRNLVRVPTIQGIQPPPWIGLLRENTSGPTIVGGMGSSIAVVVHGVEPVDLILSFGDLRVTATTGTKPEYGPNACQVAPLRGGTYHLSAPALGVEMDIFVDGRGAAIVDLRPSESEAPPQARGRLWGRVLGAGPRTLTLLGTDLRREITLPADGSYSFDKLPPGTYRLELAGKGPIAWDLKVGDAEEIHVPDVSVSPESWIAEVVSSTAGDKILGGRSSAILCEVQDRDQLAVVLSTGSWQTTARTGEKGPFKCEFGALGGGWYNVAPASLGVTLNVFVDGLGAAYVRFRMGQPVAGPTGPIGPTQPEKTMPVYLLLEQPPSEPRLFTAQVSYIQRFQPSWGFDVSGATHARHVIILGEQIDAAHVKTLTDAGCQIRRLSGSAVTLAETLERHVALGQPLETA